MQILSQSARRARIFSCRLNTNRQSALKNSVVNSCWMGPSRAVFKFGHRRPIPDQAFRRKAAHAVSLERLTASSPTPARDPIKVLPSNSHQLYFAPSMAATYSNS
jgi:hypothetical protein